MNTTILTQGVTLDEFLSSVREIIRDEVKALPAPSKVKQFLTLSEACELTGLSKSSIYRLTSKKQIPHIKRGGKLLFNSVELTQWLTDARQPVEA